MSHRCPTRSELNPLRFSVYPKVPVQPVEMQMEIVRNKRANFAGIPFSRSNWLERKLPFYLHQISFMLLALTVARQKMAGIVPAIVDLPMRLQVWSCKRRGLFAWMEKAFPFDREDFRNFKPKIWLNGKCPSCVENRNKLTSFWYIFAIWMVDNCFFICSLKSLAWFPYNGVAIECWHLYGQVSIWSRRWLSVVQE